MFCSADNRSRSCIKSIENNLSYSNINFQVKYKNLVALFEITYLGFSSNFFISPKDWSVYFLLVQLILNLCFDQNQQIWPFSASYKIIILMFNAIKCVKRLKVLILEINLIKTNSNHHLKETSMIKALEKYLIVTI